MEVLILEMLFQIDMIIPHYIVSILLYLDIINTHNLNMEGKEIDLIWFIEMFYANH